MRDLNPARLEQNLFVWIARHGDLVAAPDIERQGMGEIGAIAQSVAEMNGNLLGLVNPPSDNRFIRAGFLP